MPAESQRITLSKMRTGIEGFDQISDGGLPRGRTTLITGGPGCGKTVFALQTLVNCARRAGEAGIFVAFEESTQQILANAETFGWDIPSLDGEKLFFLDARLSPEVVKAGEFDLVGMLAMLRAKAEEIHATTVVFDGIDVLLSLLDDAPAERREIYRIQEWLAQTELTGIITQKVSGGDADLRYGFLQFMVDCAVVLKHQVVGGSAYRHLRIVKYRGSGFLGDEYPVALTSSGIRVTDRGPVELKYEVTNERLSSGLPRLDNMLSGGYYRGSNVLISGAPGTAKSTLAGLFTVSTCERGERALYVSFDEGASQIVRNLCSVGIQLAPHLRSGLLRMYSTRARGPNLEDQFENLRDQISLHQPRCLVVDPLSALAVKRNQPDSSDATQTFLDFLKGEGITVVNTSLLDGPGADEATATSISTIADTWIHVSYIVQDGERNRALTIVKARGTGHSNQVRELTLSSQGVSLTDVSISQGKVLMGVARWERENEDEAERMRTRAAVEHKRLQLELAQAEAGARLQVIQTEMRTRGAEMAVLDEAAGIASTTMKSDLAMLRRLRYADEDGGIDDLGKQGGVIREAPAEAV
jgi:circadian clock protein KaiC